MARYSGAIGYGMTIESPPDSGIYVETIIEKRYFGTFLWDNRNYSFEDGKVNPSVKINNAISIIADAYANENFMYMRYIIYQGKKWHVTSVEIEQPRIKVYMGSLYNE